MGALCANGKFDMEFQLYGSFDSLVARYTARHQRVVRHEILRVTVHRCLQSKAPKYLVDCCTPVSDIASRRHLRSASGHHLSVPRYRLSTFGRRAFSIGVTRSCIITC